MNNQDIAIQDQVVIEQILDGDIESFRILVDRHKDTLYRHCFYILRDEDAAEDIAQDSFIKAYAKISTYSHDRASFKTWLFTIATSLAFDYLRNKQRKHELPLFIDESAPDMTVELPVQAAEKRELYEKVLALDAKYRTAVLLYYWQGYSYQDIAIHMGVPIGTVRSYLSRAKSQLKEVLS